MAKKAFLWGMLALMLTFGMTVAGCGDDTTEETQNKFYGRWFEAVPLSNADLGDLTSADQIAGIVIDFPYYGTSDSPRAYIDIVKIGSTWYAMGTNRYLAESKGLLNTLQQYEFTNTHYRTMSGLDSTFGNSIPYTFNDTTISINGVDYPYTIDEKRTEQRLRRILSFMGKYFIG